MATYTPNLNLYKPDASDPFGNFREKFNDNMDILDNGGGGGGGGHTIYDENGSAMTQRAGLEFTGSVSVSDDSVNDKTIVDVKGGTSFLLNTIYSETEKRVGYWKDNKPLYQKTWDISDLSISYNSWTISTIPIGDIETIVNVLAVNQNGRAFWGDAMASLEVDATYIGFQTGRNNNVPERYRYVTIQYTKTTDTAETPELGNVIYMPTIYSDTERQVGVWRDNKPLYQKTFHTSLLLDTPNTWYQTNIGLSANNIETVAHVVQAISDTGAVWDNIGLTIDRSAYVELISSRNSGGIKVEYLTIQYTKTTDTAGSGDWTTDGTPTVHYSTNERVIGTWVDGKPVYERLIDLNGFSIDRDTWYSTNIPMSTYNIKSFVEQGSLYQDYNGFIQVFPCAVGIMASTYIGVDVKWDGGSTTRAFKYLKIRYTKTTD